ncbi:tetratricopeptide repeat protein [Nissabacter sp. SGAir0207]|uniref:tetratricopeptide repeat protein n=1 Tax=Nissabacter sp. SGAir0207 TaxID=2126321 RepID=UPI0010CD6186|nr:tetratricopeptide repeat protein [Nissabacter sp. SGAir0207]QCR37780.1 tetratricopeptide repeat protein [Nissabacter sp. SGAir0207]
MKGLPTGWTAGVVLLAGLWPALDAAARIDEPDVEADCGKIGQYANAGQAAYQQGDFAKAREIFRDQVAWSEFCRQPRDATVTAYNNIALSYLRQGMWLKARAWLQLAPDDDKSRYNLGLMQAQLDALPPPRGPAGEYWQYAGYGTWNTLVVKPQGQRYQIEYSGLYMGPMALYYGPNLGEFSTVTAIEGGHALYQQTADSDFGSACDISMAFSDQQVTLSTRGDCGFGHNVRAQGSYWRVTP